MGLEVVSGEGNFVMVHLPVSDTFVYQKLMARGVMVRTMTGFRFPNWIRISIGQMDALTALVRHLGEVLEEADRGGGPAEIRP
jgi:histidinol-phosphate aminotransferase